MDLIPEPAPNVRQLLAFYLEAGVDCALAEEPVDRLSEPDAPIASVPVRETAPTRPLRETPTAEPAVPRSEIAPAPEAAIAIAREAARTAPTLEQLRALLENFDGCALKTPRRDWCLPTATRKPASCSSAKRPVATRTLRACPLSGVPASCSTG